MSSLHSARKPHVLIVAEKWCDYNPACGISPSEHSFWGPLEASGLATFDLLHPDELHLEQQQSIDATLLRKCIETKPDLLFIIFLVHDSLNPKFETLLTIRSEFKIPIVTWWGDTNVTDIMRLAEVYSPFVDLTLAGDSTSFYLEHAKRPEKYMVLPHGKDPRVFYDPKRERDIDVSFVGTVDRPERQAALATIRSLGIEVFQTGGQREKKLTIQEYAEIYMRSKVTINLVEYGGQSIDKINGRIFESTMCGTLLLEPEWSNTKKWFEPMADYVPYRDYSDLADKIRHYLANKQERLAIAEHGHNTAMQRYDGKNFWSILLQKAAEFRVPDCEEAYHTFARLQFSNGGQKRACEAANEALASYPSSSQSFELLGDILFERKNYLEALEFYEQSLTHNSKAIGPLAGCAIIHARSKRSEESTSLLSRLLRQVRECPSEEAYLKLGTALLETGYYDECCNALKVALNKYPKSWKLALKFSECLLRKRQMDAADEIIQSFLINNLDNPYTHCQLRKMLTALNMPEMVVDYQWMLTKPLNTTVTAARQEAWILELEGKTDEAISMLKRILSYEDSKELKEKLLRLEASRGGIATQIITELS